MTLNSIFALLLLSCKIAASAGYIIHHAGYLTYHGEYYGSQAKMSVWGVPDMKPNSSYEVSITLLNFDGDHVRLIQAGVHVYPELYHDNKLHLFISANDDADRKNACYNINCRPSFVVANPKVLYPGQVILDPLSQYDGTDYYVTFSIKKDPVTEFWTVYREDFGTGFKLGWWEKGLLGDLDNKATSVQWFGFASYEDNDVGPSMGSGHYPIEGEHKAAYMADLKLFYKTGNDYDSPKISDLVRDDDKPECYRSEPAIALDGETDEHKFYYGGPAGCRN